VDGNKILGMSLGDMEGLLTAGVKAVDEKTQQLDGQSKQQAQVIQTLQQTVEDLKTQNEKLLKRLDALEGKK
jgi:hypothetical protein